MKKFTLLLFLLVFYGLFHLSAQDNKHEVLLSYGLVSHDQVLDITSDIVVEIFSLGTASTKKYNSHMGPLFFTYRYYPVAWLATGLSVGMDIAHGDIINDDTELKVGEFTRNATTVVYENYFRYIRTPIFQMYSGLAFGYTFRNYTNKSDEGMKSNQEENHIAFQINAVGLRFGKNLGGIIEMGYGYKGIICGGINYQF